MARVTAVFDDRTQAERAVTELRRTGISENDISIVSRRPDDVEVKGTGAGDDNAGGRIGKGALAGAGVGTLFGLAALVIPGVGPFITAGVLASALGATGGAVAAGAIVGGTSGALAGAFSKAGYSKEEAEYFGSTVEGGGVLVAVDADDVSTERLRSELTRLGGRTYSAGADRPKGRVDIRPNL
ncbi:MAG TPA: general stress protein [Gemmatimonadaceae bacterium]|nr:general stress protein [Gemmatimonadaceae bacterium]